ncbi:MAG: nucleotidyltransferase [Anaerolineales bacterium]|nr:nucleotidyltransferase [Anaerolineales bacterium]
MGPLADLQRLLSHFKGRGMIIGGVAASLLGTPRMTADIDVVVLLAKEELPALLDAAGVEGFFPRIPDALDFAIRHNVLLLVHQASRVNLDISLGMLPFEREAIERSIQCMVGNLELKLPRPEDLIILKAVAHRSKDLIDIQEIIRVTPELDIERIENWLHQFSELLESPEIWNDVKVLLE